MAERKRFTEDEWKQIFEEFNENSSGYDLPVQRVDTYVVASWNLRQFGTIARTKGAGRTRDIEAFRFIASVITHFDLVAIQEVKDDLESLRQLHQLLPDYDLVVSDTTGNEERLAYLYRVGKVRRTALAAEVDIPMDEIQSILKENWQAFRDALDDYGTKKTANPRYSDRIDLPKPIGFDRAPHCISFEVGPKETPIAFLAFNTHIYYGKSKSDRTQEFEAFLTWLYDRWSRVGRTFAPHFVIFGDMNAEVGEDDATTTRKDLLEFIAKADEESRQKALRRATAGERKVIEEQVTLFPFVAETKWLKPPKIGSNLLKNEHFDQIILMVRSLEAKIPGPGLWGLGVFDIPSLVAKALKGTRADQTTYELERIEQQISDHLPIWLRVELKSPL